MLKALANGARLHITTEFERELAKFKSSSSIIRKGRWIWSFTIDDEAIVSNNGTPRTSEQLMLDEAVEHAKAVIDAYRV